MSTVRDFIWIGGRLLFWGLVLILLISWFT
jgi:hypothetical protein